MGRQDPHALERARLRRSTWSGVAIVTAGYFLGCGMAIKKGRP